MPGLVPGIHVLRHRGARRERAKRWMDVDARNKSGHDVGGKRATPVPATDGAGVPQSEPRSGRWVVNPCIPWPHTRSMGIKPDSNGTSPGMTTGGRRRVDHDGRWRRCTPAQAGRRSSCRSAPADRPSSYPYKPLSKGGRGASRRPPRAIGSSGDRRMREWMTSRGYTYAPTTGGSRPCTGPAANAAPCATRSRPIL